MQELDSVMLEHATDSARLESQRSDMPIVLLFSLQVMWTSKQPQLNVVLNILGEHSALRICTWNLKPM